MRAHRSATLMLVAASTLFVACGDKIDAVQLDESCPDLGAVTYEGAIASFMTNHCQRCHSSNVSGGDRNGAPTFVNYDSYAEAERSAAQALSRVLEGSMPPDKIISACDRQRLQAWVDQGKLER